MTAGSIGADADAGGGRGGAGTGRDSIAPAPRGDHLTLDAADAPLTARGQRVWVAPVTKADLAPYRRAVECSRERVAHWNPVDPTDLERHLRFQSSGHRTFIVHAVARRGEHDIVGRVNVTNVVRGRALAATLGYDAYDPYAGRGLFAEGLRLVVDLALAPEPRGVGLHRLEASVQPGNVRSAGLLRSLGFCRRGAWPDYLWLPDGTGLSAWRDHVTYGVVASGWPAPPYAAEEPTRPVVLVAPGHPTVAAALARELAVPLLDEAAVMRLGASLPAVLQHGPGWVLVGTLTDVREALRAADVSPEAVTVVGPAEMPYDDAAVCRVVLDVRARDKKARDRWPGAH